MSSEENEVSELDAIRSYGLTVQGEEEAARRPAPRPADAPWAESHALVVVEPNRALLNIAMIKGLVGLGSWGSKYDDRLTKCGILWIRRDGGEFADGQSVAALFDAGIFGPSRRGRLCITVCRSMADFQAPLPYDARRVSDHGLFDPFSMKPFPEIVERRLRMSERLPTGGAKRSCDPQSLEQLLPLELGGRTDRLATDEGQVLWIRYLPLEDSSE